MASEHGAICLLTFNIESRRRGRSLQPPASSA